MVFLGTLWGVQWYTLGGTVVHFGGYSGTLWGVQWYTLGGTVVQSGGLRGTLAHLWKDTVGHCRGALTHFEVYMNAI